MKSLGGGEGAALVYARAEVLIYGWVKNFSVPFPLPIPHILQWDWGNLSRP